MSRAALTLHFHNDETLRNLERTAEALGVSMDDFAEVAIGRELAAIGAGKSVTGLEAVASGSWAVLSLQDCVIAGNRVGEGSKEPFGAGMLCRDSRVRIQKSTLSGNVVDPGSAATAAGGGGLFFQDCQVEMTGSTAQGNAVYAERSARGGGIWCERGTLRMWRSRVTDNALHAASCAGAGLYFDAPRGCQLGGSVITGNGSPRGRGGGVFVEGDPSRVSIHRNTVVRQNHPTDIDFGESDSRCATAA